MVSATLFIAIAYLAFVAFVGGTHLSFHPPKVVDKLNVDDKLNLTITFHDIKKPFEHVIWSTESEPSNVLSAELSSVQCQGRINISCNGTLQVEGLFLGFGKVFILEKNVTSQKVRKLKPPLEVVVVRQDKVINKVFTAFVATIVTINYINMGCALDIGVVKKVLKRPIGPAVGFVCQFLVMPLVSYGVGYLLFEDPVLRLGLFTFGCSPGGGASNMWTVLLGGNLNLSITMTFVSTLAALATIPLWLFTLGKTILEGTNIVIPYSNILISLASLTIPIGLGLLIQRYFPKVASRSKKILAPICIIMIIGIIILASVANSYMFYMLTWQMVIAASLSVWTGFIAGALASMVFRFPTTDMVAVAVETGIQNSGIAFVLLSYTLKPPVSEMASVVPVAGSIITPIPLFVIYCYQRFRNCCFKTDKLELQAINSKKSVDTSSVKGFDNLAQQSDINY
ncbi:ileal sodium/bile acid cotransporter-like [Stegodyphus dumicola]|uniref:ileal sodium/bile acid cotransporter-like n=1 Tax=Stegodyphus dumicola TaxID=202533 RepID=UPI0015A9FCB1|nr:ileal sodium/bile acid cotransporter-like [Stegodyphus dumicola]